MSRLVTAPSASEGAPRLESLIRTAGVALGLLLVMGCDVGSDVGTDVGRASPVEHDGPVTEPAVTDAPYTPDSAETAETRSARALLARVAQAETEITYSGVKVAVHGRPGESRATRMRVHRFADGTTILEWGGTDGVPARWRYTERFAWLRDVDLLLENYRVVTKDGALEPIAGHVAIAGHLAQELEIMPLRAGRPSLALALDIETGLVLSETYHRPDGSVRLANRFESISYGEPDIELPEDTSECLEVTTGGPTGQTPQEQAQIQPEGWRPLSVSHAPEGFVRIGRELLPCGTLREYWTDGLAAFSVLQRPAAQSGDAALEDRTEGELTCDTSSGMDCLAGVFAGIRVIIQGSLSRESLEAVVRGLSSPASE